MTRALPKQYRCALCCLCFGIMVGGCGPVDVVREEAPVPKDAVIDRAVKVLATASSSQPEDGLPVTAEIVDVIDGGRSGEWGVRVFFPNGTGEGCSVDVLDRRRGDLLAHDDVSSS